MALKTERDRWGIKSYPINAELRNGSQFTAVVSLTIPQSMCAVENLFFVSAAQDLSHPSLRKSSSAGVAESSPISRIGIVILQRRPTF